MDTEQIELFPAMEYVDLSHGMTARSTRSKTPTKRRKRSPSTKVTIASQQSETPISATDLETRIRQANELRKSYYSN